MKGWAPPSPSADLVVVPVHPGQWPRVQERFPQARLLEGTQSAYPQTSVRMHGY